MKKAIQLVKMDGGVCRLSEPDVEPLCVVNSSYTN